MATSFSTATPFVLFLLLSISSALGAPHYHTAAPAPAVDCSTLILNMADCLSFVQAGGTETKPQSTCCSGLKTVLKADAKCLCEALKSSASFGITLNMTKAATLPTACKLHAPSVSNCGLSVTPTMAPGLAPGGAVAAGPGGAAAAGPGGAAAAGPGAAGTTLAPNPSPGNDGSSLIPTSFTTLFTALFFVLFLSRM